MHIVDDDDVVIPLGMCNVHSFVRSNDFFFRREFIHDNFSRHAEQPAYLPTT